MFGSRCEHTWTALNSIFLNFFFYNFVISKQLCAIWCFPKNSSNMSNMFEYQWKTDDLVRIVDHFYTKNYLSVHLQSTTYHIGNTVFPSIIQSICLAWYFSSRGVFNDGLVRFSCSAANLRAPLIHHLNFSHTKISCESVYVYGVVILFAMNVRYFISVIVCLLLSLYLNLYLFL